MQLGRLLQAGALLAAPASGWGALGCEPHLYSLLTICLVGQSENVINCDLLRIAQNGRSAKHLGEVPFVSTGGANIARCAHYGILRLCYILHNLHVALLVAGSTQAGHSPKRRDRIRWIE